MVQGVTSSNVNDLSTSLKQGSSSDQVQRPVLAAEQARNQVKTANSAATGDTVSLSSDYTARGDQPTFEIKPPSLPVTYDEKNALYKAYAALSHTVTSLFHDLNA